MKFRAKKEPFIESYYSEDARSALSPSAWWKLFDIPEPILKVVLAILSCAPSTADLERVFSAFQWVHSKERNRMGTAKAAKLVFILKTLNS